MDLEPSSAFLTVSQHHQLLSLLPSRGLVSHGDIVEELRQGKPEREVNYVHAVAHIASEAVAAGLRAAHVDATEFDSVAAIARVTTRSWAGSVAPSAPTDARSSCRVSRPATRFEKATGSASTFPGSSVSTERSRCARQCSGPGDDLRRAPRHPRRRPRLGNQRHGSWGARSPRRRSLPPSPSSTLASLNTARPRVGYGWAFSSIGP